MTLGYRTAIVLLIVFALPTHADLSIEHALQQTAGSMLAEHDGRTVLLAAMTSHYDVQVSGDIADVRVTQTFRNPFDAPINARYLFPLYQRAAVHAMTMRVGDEVVQAQIQPKQQAQQTFAQAKSAGKAASLLTQHRPNMFTQQIANLMPGSEMQIEIRYTHTVKQVDGHFELVVPMVVGPRFQPPAAPPAASLDPQAPIDDPTMVTAATTTTTTNETWTLQQLPSYPPTHGIDLPGNMQERVTMVLTLETPEPLQFVHSDSHPLATTMRADNAYTLQFATFITRRSP